MFWLCLVTRSSEFLGMTTGFRTFGKWQQDKSDKFDWKLGQGATSSSNTGPSAGVGGSGW